MAGSYPFSVGEYQHKASILCTIPASGAGEFMSVQGSVFGHSPTGSAPFFLSGGLAGKTLLITDLQATNVAQKEIKFLSTQFANASQPTLAEVVAAINAKLSVDATPTIASAGAQGNLVITGAAAGATASLTVGAGTANILFGFPKSGVYVRVLNGTGVDIVFPAGIRRDYLYSKAPALDVHTVTVATGVRTRETTFTAVWTPSSRVLRIANSGGATRIAQIDVAF